MDRLLKILFAFLFGAMLAMPTIAWMGKVQPTDHAVFRLAADLSGGDETILQTVADYIRNPPTDRRTIGFYSGDSYPEKARVYLSAVTLLSNAGFIQTVTDKYLPELFIRWVADGAINRDRLTSPSQEMLDALTSGQDWVDEPSEDDLEERARFFEARYAAFVSEIEAQFAADGSELISIDATGGDTLYFAVVEPEIAARWKGKTFSYIDDPRGRYFNGVRAPMWDRAWHALVYAYLLPVVKPTYTRPVPEGVRLRAKTLPWVE